MISARVSKNAGPKFAPKVKPRMNRATAIEPTVTEPTLNVTEPALTVTEPTLTAIEPTLALAEPDSNMIEGDETTLRALEIATPLIEAVLTTIVPTFNVIPRVLCNAIAEISPLQELELREEANTETNADAEVDEEPQLNIQQLIRSRFLQGSLSTVEKSRRLARAEARKANQRANRIDNGADNQEVSVIEEGSVDGGQNASSGADHEDASVRDMSSPEPETSREDADIGPRLIMVDGKVVVDKSSLEVSVSYPTEELTESNVTDERQGRHLTSASFRKKQTRIKWDADSVVCLYEGLSYFGTDFSLIALYIKSHNPSMADCIEQRHVRLRFTLENKNRGDLVTKAFKEKKAPTETVMQKMKSATPQRTIPIEAALIATSDDTGNVEAEEESSMFQFAKPAAIPLQLIPQLVRASSIRRTASLALIPPTTASIIDSEPACQDPSMEISTPLLPPPVVVVREILVPSIRPSMVRTQRTSFKPITKITPAILSRKRKI